jgi:hypothetical protein
MGLDVLAQVEDLRNPADQGEEVDARVGPCAVPTTSQSHPALLEQPEPPAFFAARAFIGDRSAGIRDAKRRAGRRDRQERVDVDRPRAAVQVKCQAVD